MGLWLVFWLVWGMEGVCGVFVGVLCWWVGWFVCF